MYLDNQDAAIFAKIRELCPRDAMMVFEEYKNDLIESQYMKYRSDIHAMECTNEGLDSINIELRQENDKLIEENKRLDKENENLFLACEERTKESERLREYLKWALTYVEASEEEEGLCSMEQSIYDQSRALVNGFAFIRKEVDNGRS